jgi:AAA+ ATPase superfamily predicted ATPase
MSKKLNKPILTTDPHGEQSLRRCDNEDDQTIGNLLFELSSNSDDSAIVMTGEELTSLANRWLEHWRANNQRNTQCRVRGLKAATADLDNVQKRGTVKV